MSEHDEQSDHLSEFERAVCYYTLPKVTSPVTLGLIVAYAVCFLEAAGVMVYGLVQDSMRDEGQATVSAWTKWGTVALVAIIIFGIVAFLFRAFMNDLRQRRMLATARGVPDAIVETEDVPNPFGGHLLIRYPRHPTSRERSIMDNDGHVLYTVVEETHGKNWSIAPADGEGVLSVKSSSRGVSFGFDRGTPAELRVLRDDKEVAHVKKRFSFATPSVIISASEPEPHEIVARGRSLYHNERLIGRIYYIRRYLYLDIEKDRLNDGILGFFVAMV